jgi:hypothetical protein
MRLFHALTMASLAAATPAAALVVEDFESAGPKDVALSSLMTSVGLFTPIAPGNNVWVASPGYTNFGPGLNPTTSSILTANGDEGFELVFALAASSFQTQIYLNDLGPATLELFNDATLLFSITYQADGDDTNNLVGLGVWHSVPMTRMTFVSTLGGRLNTGLDNISLSPFGAVPEPSSWALMIGGFALAGAAMRRKRASVSFA